jgi:hypothetical protein
MPLFVAALFLDLDLAECALAAMSSVLDGVTMVGEFAFESSALLTPLAVFLESWACLRGTAPPVLAAATVGVSLLCGLVLC